MRREAVRAKALAAIQAEDVFLLLPAILMDPTLPEECLRH